MNKLKSIVSPFNLFLGINLINFILFVYFLLDHGQGTLDWLMMENRDLDFCDFAMHLGFVANRAHLYERAVGIVGCFPPLSYIMYYLFYKTLATPDIQPFFAYDIMKMPYYQFIALVYSIMVLSVFLYGISLYGTRDDKRSNTKLLVCLLLSTPFIAGISTANSTMLVMSLLVIAIKLREDNDWKKKELALFIIAICCGFKIYPAVFGLLYLLEKRFGEAIRLTIYGIVAFFAPFALFGGRNGFNHWLINVKSTMGLDDFGRIQSMRGLVNTLMLLDNKAPSETLLKVVTIAFFVIMVLLACITKSKFRRLFFISSIMVFFPNNAYRYTLSYLAIPLIYFFLENDMDKNVYAGVQGIDTILIYIETFFYSFIFAIPMIQGKMTHFELSFPYYTLTYVEVFVYSAAYIALLILVIHEISDFIVRNIKARGKA